MRKLLSVVTLLPLLAAAACAAAPVKGASKAAPGKAQQYKAYAMEGGYFSCQVPADWAQERDAEKDAEYKIYELQLLSPKGGRERAFIKVSYYLNDNADFSGPKDFVDSNSKNAMGETKSARESYDPVKEVRLAGRKAQLLARERTVFLHHEGKSDESVRLKERLLVLPAKGGFYVLHLSAPKDDFAAALPVFDKVSKTFKGLP